MKLAAHFAAEEVRLGINDVFSYQFALAPAGMIECAEFENKHFGVRILHHCPKLDVASLLDRDGVELGYCLGVAVDEHGRRVQDRASLDVSSGAADFWDSVEHFAIGLGGRWLLLIRNGDDARVFGDASGHYNCVYDPQSGIIGATLLMCLNRPIEETDERDYRQTMTMGLRLPFGRTRDKHARRLAVNHFLRLADMTETRFWPRAGDLNEVGEDAFERVIADMRGRLALIFGGIVRSAPVAVGMSGGNDSRNLVAAGKAHLPHVKRFFTHVHNRNSRADYQSAVQVMEQLGYQVERYDVAEAPYSDEELSRRNAIFQRSTGYCVGLHQMTNVNLNRSPEPGEIIVIGNVMEVLRGAFWNAAEKTRRHNFKFGLKRCLFVSGEGFNAAFVSRWLPEFKYWYSGLPLDAKKVYVDLVFMEHYMPSFGTILHSQMKNFTVCPFNDRKIIALCAQLPLHYRFSNQANSAFLKASAPELLDVPFARDLMRSARR